MALETLNLGSTPNDGTGEDLRSGGEKINAAIAAVDARVVAATLSTWNASGGTFPSGSLAGQRYRVTTGGTVDSVVFVAGDFLNALVDGASTTVYADNWRIEHHVSAASVDGAVSTRLPFVASAADPDSAPAAVPSVHFNTSTGKYWFAAGAITVGDWIPQAVGIAHEGGAPPTVDNDETEGFRIGSTWEYGGSLWICADASDGAAVWLSIGLSSEQEADIASAIQPGDLFPTPLPYINTAETYDLSNDDIGRTTVHSTHATPTLTVTPDADEEWMSGAVVNLTTVNAAQVVADTGVTINGSLESTWDLGAYGAATLIWLSADNWYLGGNVSPD